MKSCCDFVLRVSKCINPSVLFGLQDSSHAAGWHDECYWNVLPIVQTAAVDDCDTIPTARQSMNECSSEQTHFISWWRWQNSGTKADWSHRGWCPTWWVKGQHQHRHWTSESIHLYKKKIKNQESLLSLCRHNEILFMDWLIYKKQEIWCSSGQINLNNTSYLHS